MNKPLTIHWKRNQFRCGDLTPIPWPSHTSTPIRRPRRARHTTPTLSGIIFISLTVIAPTGFAGSSMRARSCSTLMIWNGKSVKLSHVRLSFETDWQLLSESCPQRWFWEDARSGELLRQHGERNCVWVYGLYLRADGCAFGFSRFWINLWK